MAITSSAKKALRSSETKRQYNLRRKWAIQKVEKEIRKLVTDKKITEAKALIPKAYQALDKAAKTNLIKKNTASRQKSRLVAFITRAESPVNKTA